MKPYRLRERENTEHEPHEKDQTRDDEFIIMPNHFHCVIHFVNPTVGAIHESPLPSRQRFPTQVPQKASDPHEKISLRRMLLPKLVGYLKMNSAKQTNILRGSPGVPIWQRNYYEHVITTDREYDAFVAYIHPTPLTGRWTRKTPTVNSPFTSPLPTCANMPPGTGAVGTGVI